MDFSSIRSKTTLALVLLAVVIISVSTALALLYFEKRMKEEIYVHQAAVLNLAAEELDARLALARKALLAAGGGINEAVLADPASAHRLLAGQPALNAIFDNGLYLLSGRGEIITQAPLGKDRHDGEPPFARWCAEAASTGKPVISDGFYSGSGRAAIILALPLLDSQGRAMAVLAGGFDLLGSNILTNIVAQRTNWGGKLYIVDTGRTIIAHADKGRIMAKGAAAGLAGLLDKGGAAGAGYTKDGSGARALTSFKRLKSAGWTIAADYPLVEAYAPIHSARKALLIGACAVLLLSALLILTVIHRFTSPLIALTENIKKIADRKATAKPLPVTGDDEAGILAQAFNDLLEDMEQHKRFYGDLVKCSAIPTFVIDKDHKLLVWNLACEELTGIRSVDILGTDGQMDSFYGTRLKTLADIAIDENFEELAKRYEIISESLLIPNGWHAEGWIKGLNGRDRYLLIETTPIHNRKRELVGAIECLQDITERVEMMEALKESEEKFKSIAEQVNVLLAEREG